MVVIFSSLWQDNQIKEGQVPFVPFQRFPSIVTFGPIASGTCDEAAQGTCDGVQILTSPNGSYKTKRETGGSQGLYISFKSVTSYIPPNRYHLPKGPALLNGAMNWRPSLQHMSLLVTFKVQILTPWVHTITWTLFWTSQCSCTQG